MINDSNWVELDKHLVVVNPGSSDSERALSSTLVNTLPFHMDAWNTLINLQLVIASVCNVFSQSDYKHYTLFFWRSRNYRRHF